VQGGDKCSGRSLLGLFKHIRFAPADEAGPPCSWSRTWKELVTEWLVFVFPIVTTPLTKVLSVIPDYANMRWYVRAPTYGELVLFVDRVKACFE
jgi:hypothetical protein